MKSKVPTGISAYIDPATGKLAGSYPKTGSNDDTEAALTRYAAVAEHVGVDSYELACPRGQVVIERWERRWEVKVSFVNREVAEAFAAALRKAKEAQQ